MDNKRYVWLFLVAAAWTASVPTRAPGCTIPVFAYALERWPAEPAPVMLFHRGPLTEAAQQFHTRLDEAATMDANQANVQIISVNVDEPMDDAAATAWQPHTNATLPLAVCLYPDQSREFWAGTPDAEQARLLIDSPARRTTARHLLKGATAVWILVSTGNAAKDARAQQALGNALTNAQQSLKLPEVDPADAAEILTSPAATLHIEFPILTVRRDDPAEVFFVRMLENAFQPPPRDEPAAYVIFGRGRVATQFCGDQINKENILPVCAFLTGQCSCQVKEMNPGVDLLFAAGWSQYVSAPYRVDEQLPDLVGTPVLAPAPAPPKTPAPPAPPSPEPAPKRRFTRGGLLAAALAPLALIGLLSLALHLKRRRNE